MDIHFIPITNKNRKQAEALRPAREQQEFVESVSRCLREADHKKIWRPVGIYDGERLIGFSMYGFFRWEYFPFGRLWLDRLLIDRRYQGKGCGKAALAGLLDRLSREYPGKKIYLSVVKGNDTAIRLYEGFGFRFNGKKDIHGEDIMVRA